MLIAGIARRGGRRVAVGGVGSWKRPSARSARAPRASSLGVGRGRRRCAATRVSIGVGIARGRASAAAGPARAPPRSSARAARSAAAPLRLPGTGRARCARARDQRRDRGILRIELLGEAGDFVVAALDSARASPAASARRLAARRDCATATEMSAREHDERQPSSAERRSLRRIMAHIISDAFCACRSFRPAALRPADSTPVQNISCQV